MNNINKSSIDQRGQRYIFDVLVIGSGLGGLFFVLELLQLQPKLKIALICKETLYESNSRYAQGGVAAVLNHDDAVTAHIQDTLQAGDGLCYGPVVEHILRQAPDVIHALIALGVEFSKDHKGAYTLAQEGGHSARRILHQDDRTGYYLIETLIMRLKQYPQVHCFEHHAAINLIVHTHPHRVDNQGEVLGAYVLSVPTEKIHTFFAHTVILATGGAGKTYQYTSNPMIATGDGVAMAYRAGARVGNMEFYQFHPTLLYHPTHHYFLLSEALRGEGGILRNPDTGVRFMEKIAPLEKELATRDIVARAIFNEIEHGVHPYVYLDMTHHKRSFLQRRFPQINQTLLSLGIDMSQEPVPVVPGAHYQCGGVLVDSDGRTDLKRLWAIGEVAFSGLHGANRLASNSLLEALVMAYNAARACLMLVTDPISKLVDITPDWNTPGEVNLRRASQINAHWRGLRSEMTSYAGIVRTEAGLRDVFMLIKARQTMIDEYYWSSYITRDLIELRNIVLNAALIASAALARRESRGGHYREDFPYQDKIAKESILRLSVPMMR